jgi:hypothetical protein
MDGEASVSPNQPWASNGTAEATPLPPFPDTDTRTLPLENRQPRDMTILRSRYPRGLVIIPMGSAPSVSPATLPIKSSGGEEILIDGDTFVEWPTGLVAWFQD